MGEPSDDPVTRNSVRRGPASARDWPDAPNRARSTKEPAKAPTCEPIAAPDRLAPSREMPAGSAAEPAAAPATASASVAMGGDQQSGVGNSELDLDRGAKDLDAGNACGHDELELRQGLPLRPGVLARTLGPRAGSVPREG